MDANTTLLDVIDNIDARLACLRCGVLVTEPYLTVTQMPSPKACVGFIVAILCADCRRANHSAAADIVNAFAGCEGVTTDPMAWKHP